MNHHVVKFYSPIVAPLLSGLGIRAHTWLSGAVGLVVRRRGAVGLVVRRRGAVGPIAAMGVTSQSLVGR